MPNLQSSDLVTPDCTQVTSVSDVQSAAQFPCTVQDRSFPARGFKSITTYYREWSIVDDHMCAYAHIHTYTNESKFKLHLFFHYECFHTVFNLFHFLFWTDSPRHFWWYHLICWLMSAAGIICILVGHEHYTVDVVIAYYITTRLFWWYHSMANEKVSILPVLYQILKTVFTSYFFAQLRDHWVMRNLTGYFSFLFLNDIHLLVRDSCFNICENMKHNQDIFILIQRD